MIIIWIHRYVNPIPLRYGAVPYLQK
jgi:hypothetical protein